MSWVTHPLELLLVSALDSLDFRGECSQSLAVIRMSLGWPGVLRWSGNSDTWPRGASWKKMHAHLTFMRINLPFHMRKVTSSEVVDNLGLPEQDQCRTSGPAGMCCDGTELGVQSILGRKVAAAIEISKRHPGFDLSESGAKKLKNTGAK